jgi:2-polyprenyl-6-methoxyphenol hydroxylase-like FAD-dependent oxidoreductase
MNYLRYLGFHTAAYTFAHPELHRKLGEQFALTDSVDKTVGLYPIRNERIAVFTAHRTTDSAIPADPRMIVRTTYSDLGWLVPDALAHCPNPPALYYDQVAQIEMPRWTTGRVALVGDACQAVSLLAGQGASLAVAGAQLMASELATEANVPMRSPATTHTWQRPWRTNRLRDGEPPNGSFPLPHAGSCFGGSPSGPCTCQVLTACSARG